MSSTCKFSCCRWRTYAGCSSRPWKPSLCLSGIRTPGRRTHQHVLLPVGLLGVRGWAVYRPSPLRRGAARVVHLAVKLASQQPLEHRLCERAGAHIVHGVARVALGLHREHQCLRWPCQAACRRAERRRRRCPTCPLRSAHVPPNLVVLIHLAELRKYLRPKGGRLLKQIS